MNDDTKRGPDERSGSSKSSWGTGAWGSAGMEDFADAETVDESTGDERRSSSTVDHEEKSPAVAGLLALLPGAGHLYLGAIQRGLTFTGVFLAMIFALNTYEFRPLHPLIGIGLPFVIIYNIIDAVRGARAINRSIVAGTAAPDLGVPWVSDREEKGSRTTGIVLIGMGVLLLGVTRFDLDLRWLVEWWPAVLIFLGIRMVSRAREDA